MVTVCLLRTSLCLLFYLPLAIAVRDSRKIIIKNVNISLRIQRRWTGQHCRLTVRMSWVRFEARPFFFVWSLHVLLNYKTIQSFHSKQNRKWGLRYKVTVVIQPPRGVGVLPFVQMVALLAFRLTHNLSPWEYWWTSSTNVMRYITIYNSKFASTCRFLFNNYSSPRLNVFTSLIYQVQTKGN